MVKNWYWKRAVKEDGGVCYVAYCRCTQCGEEFISGNPARAEYCGSCKKAIVKAQTRERVRNHRQGNKPAAAVEK